MPRTLDVPSNSLSSVLGGFLAQDFAPLDTAEVIDRGSVRAFTRVGRRKDREVLTASGFESFGDANNGGQLCCGAGFADVHAEESVQLGADALNLFSRW